MNRYQDPIAVSWDDSLFRLEDDSFTKVDKYDGYDPALGVIFGKVTNQIHSSENAYANGYPAGVSWYADLKGYIGNQPTKLYGYGTFNLKPKFEIYNFTTTLYGKYIHLKTSAEISLNIFDYGNISFSGGGDHDELATQTTIEW